MSPIRHRWFELLTVAAVVLPACGGGAGSASNSQSASALTSSNSMAVFVASNPRFYSPAGSAVDGAGNVYVADSGNSTIRKITPGGEVSTLAGTAGVAGNADGAGTQALFAQPNSVAVDGS